MRLLVVLLAAAVILPTVCLLWFMSRAVKNERLAVRQRLVVVYTRQAEQLAAEFDEFYDKLGQDYIQVVQQHPLQESFGDVHGKLIPKLTSDYPALVVYNPEGQVIYPAPAGYDDLPPELPGAFYRAWELEFEKKDFVEAIKSYKSLAAVTHGYVRVQALLAAARCRRKLGDNDQAIEICRAIIADPNLTLTAASRASTINTRILLVELSKSIEPDSSAQELNNLLNLTRDFTLPLEMRLFIWEKYKDFISPASIASQVPDDVETTVERQLEAEKLSIAAAQQFADVSFFEDWSDNTVHSLDISKKMYGMFSRTEDRQFLIIRPPVDLTSFQDAFEGSSVGFRVLDDREELVAGMNFGGQDYKEPAFLSIPMGEHFPGWQIEYYFQDEEIFAQASRRQNMIYIWTGVLVIVLVLTAGLFAGRLVNRQIRLNRLKNDFVATVSHELKTPLSSIRVLVDTLLEGRHQDQQQVEDYLQMMSRENERLNRLIDNFLTFSRMERNKQVIEISPADAAAIARAAAGAVKTKYKKCDCQLALQIDEPLPEVAADFDAMVMVLVNLLDNGCKYSYDDYKKVELKVYARDGSVFFVVVDEGIGLSKRAQKCIFDRFYRVDQSLSRRVEGSGLGLSIVKYIVDAHQGTIEVKSAPDQGSTFTVRLPIGI